MEYRYKSKVYRLVFIFILLINSCNKNTSNHNKQNKDDILQDKINLEELVDNMVILHDKRNVDDMLERYAIDDIIFEIIETDNSKHTYFGKHKVRNKLNNINFLFDRIQHINGQKTFDIKGNTATGICYSILVTTSVNEHNKVEVLSKGVIFTDEYIKKNNQWFIKIRKCQVIWKTLNIQPQEHQLSI